ncbi:hypothetical protein MTBSS4_60123 [Magnetospirillum sp. SS-4]|nr:hypothetical protein MTBSS4_60123 [Magnetospirillum sp. SS-4]
MGGVAHRHPPQMGRQFELARLAVGGQDIGPVRRHAGEHVDRAGDGGVDHHHDVGRIDVGDPADHLIGHAQEGHDGRPPAFEAKGRNSHDMLAFLDQSGGENGRCQNGTLPSASMEAHLMHAFRPSLLPTSLNMDERSIRHQNTKLHIWKSKPFFCITFPRASVGHAGPA